jgi:hypothetical protein
MKYLLPTAVPLLLLFNLHVICQTKGGLQAPIKFGTATIIFHNTVHHQPLVLNDSTYTNPFEEQYILSKFKYYISGIRLMNSQKKWVLKQAYYLINQSIDSSLQLNIALQENSYDSIAFLLGVDSARNTSGAQRGALDPLNDMFWTWQSGYIMQKLEGTSPQSSIVNNKIEYHIGGYSGVNSVLQQVVLPFPNNNMLVIQRGSNSIININAEIDYFWSGVVDVKIKDTPICSAPGLMAKQMAANFSKLFTISSVVNNQ